MSTFDSTIWIVHRDAGPRGALGRLASAAPGRHEVVLGAPGDSVWSAASPADVVVLDVSGRLARPEPELDLARRVQRDNPDCAWILVTEADELEPTLRLFDTLDARVIAGPPDLRTVVTAVTAALQRSRALPLSHRSSRDHLSARFVRWFSTGEPRELALALDPRLAAEPVLARGETGTGRGLLLRYVHVTSTPSPGPFVRVACSPATSAEDLIAQIEDGIREAGPSRGRYGIWLDELDRLADRTQARVLDWIEFGAPRVLPSRVRRNLRWFASAGRDPMRLSVRLALAFAELTVRTVPLRERPQVIPAFVADTARAWAAARGEEPKSFDPRAVDLLRAEPWPGNLAELEAVVIRTLAHADPLARTLHAEDLRFGPEVDGGEAPAPRPAPTAAAPPEPRTDLPPLPTVEDAPPFTPFEPVDLAEEAPAAPEAAEDEAALVEEEGAAEEPVVILQPETGGDLPDAEEVIDLLLPEPDAETAPAEPDSSVARLAKAVAHEVRNPLVSIRTFSDLLHDHYQDEDFRDRFGRLVADDVRRIEAVVDRLERMGAAPDEQASGPVDMTSLLEGLLDEQRARIQEKRLLVLKELDRARPHALGDAGLLRSALAGLLDRAIEETPERGDLYLASRRQTGPEGPDRMRILVRYRVPRTPSDGDLALQTFRATNLQAEVAGSILERQGGSLRVDMDDPDETLIVVELPAPPLAD